MRLPGPSVMSRGGRVAASWAGSSAEGWVAAATAGLSSKVADFGMSLEQPFHASAQVCIAGAGSVKVCGTLFGRPFLQGGQEDRFDATRDCS